MRISKIIFILISFTFSLFIFIARTRFVFAQTVVINEFSSAASNSSDSDWPDWVEVYKGGEDIALYELKDAAGNIKVLSDAACNGEFCTVDWSNKLNNSGDTIMLVLVSDPENVIDSVTYGAEGTVCSPDHGQSIGRVVLTEAADPGNTIERFAISSKGLSNYGSVLAPCPSPTPIPTPTPTSTPKPTNTPAPTSTPTPKATSAPTPKPTIRPTTRPTTEPKINPPELSDSSDNTDNLRAEILGSNTEGDDEPSADAGRKFPVFPTLFMSLGTGLLGFAGFTFIKQRKKEYNLGDDEFPAKP